MENFEINKYINQLKKFFDENPNDLYDLIGKMDSDKFYKKVGVIAQKNYQETGLVEIKQNQLIDIVIDLYEEMGHTPTKIEIDGIFQKTSPGFICLN